MFPVENASALVLFGPVLTRKELGSQRVKTPLCLAFGDVGELLSNPCFLGAERTGWFGEDI